MRKILYLLCFWLCSMVLSQKANAQSKVILTMPDHSIVSSWNWITGVPTFSIPAINAIFSTHGVSQCRVAYPESRYPYFRKVYRVTCTDTGLVSALNSSYPQYFKAEQELKSEVTVDPYYPNDIWNDTLSIYYLTYIRAPWAWGLSKGSSDMLIGVNDHYVNASHPELSGKLAFVRSLGSSHADHGTMVSGIAAGATDNGTGLPSIGFNCRIDFIDGMGMGNTLYLSNQGRKIINNSWRNVLVTDELNLEAFTGTNWMANQIYENGTFDIFAAGNGDGTPWKYIYPSSLDNIFCVSGVGWAAPYGGTETWLVQGVHDRDIAGDTSVNHQHNSRVDLLAPSFHMGGLTYDPDTPSKLYTKIGLMGTSFAAPLVAGTAGLMHTEQPCLSPYQTEYLLKKGANDTILDYPENAHYEGRLGWGALNAYKSLFYAKYGENVGVWNSYHNSSSEPPSELRSNPCNDPATQTMYIKGIDVTGICQPSEASNGHQPKFKVIIENGVPPYTYRWEPVNDGMSAGNNTTLDDYYIAEPKIVTSYGNHTARYRVYVYDNSQVQKVAAKYIEIQLTDEAAFDLASRDSEMDMLDEPNSQYDLDPREWRIWDSPDLWVRHTDDGGTTPLHPEYFTTNPNFVYVKVRNVGCQPAPSGAGNVKLYWTLASTGENWSGDWTGATLVGASAGGVIPGGGQIGSSKPTPALQPGQSTIIKWSWHPTRPQDFFGSPTSVDVCLLSRIEQSPGYPHGMTFSEVSGSVTPNIRNNNNIVTRNVLVTDLHPGNMGAISRRIFVANPLSVRTVFTLDLVDNRRIHPHLSGDFSSIGHVKVRLGPLYDKWVTGGSLGTYTSANPQTKTIIFNGVDDMRLENITLDPGERFDVNLEFVVDDDDALTGNKFLFHFRQFTSVNDTVPIGAVSLLVNTYPDQQPMNMTKELPEPLNGNFILYPNPADNVVHIRNNYVDINTKITVYDVTGRIVSTDELFFSKGSDKTLNIGNLVAGIYFVAIEASDGTVERHKFVKQ